MVAYEERTGEIGRASAWRIRLLGGLRAEQEDHVVARFPTRQTAALLAYLALQPDAHHGRETLIDRLWPDADLDSGRGSLSWSLHQLRRLLETHGLASGSVFVADRLTIRLNAATVTTDVVQFQAALRAAEEATDATKRIDALRRAVEFYTGELLPGHYDDWILRERDRLAESYRRALRGLVQELEAQSDLEGARRTADLACRADPSSEDACRQLMRLHAQLGDGEAALRCCAALERELAADGELLSEATRSLAEAIRAGSVGVRGYGCGTGPNTQHSTPRHNLPVQLTSFIGRERELAEVKALLGIEALRCYGAARVSGETPECLNAVTPAHLNIPTPYRLITLTGSGGVGKSRLALRVGADLLEQFPDGVWLVELAGLTGAGLVPQAIARPLGMLLDDSRPVLRALIDYLEPKSLLLILDNCEHLLDACASLVDALLRACPQVKVLASSRQGLGIAGEFTYRVPSLSMPDQCQAVTAEGLTQYESARLFIERASFSKPGLTLTNANAHAIAQVCRCLDGIPLCIELAAARAKAMPLDEITGRPDDLCRLLTGGSRTALPRHRTLRALIDWSYDLLTDPERLLLRRLSVFMGGWTLKAAEAVWGDEGDESVEALGRFGVKECEPPNSAAAQPLAPLTPEHLDALDVLTSLVDKSLVIFEEPSAGTPHSELRTPHSYYRLLETVRQYAREKLLESGEGEALRDRHLAYFLAFAEEAEERCKGPEQIQWLDRLEAEQDNLRAALAWGLARPGAEGDTDGWRDREPERQRDRTVPPSPPPSISPSLRLATALGHFWELRGRYREGIGWLERALDAGADLPSASRARALEAAGYLHWRSFSRSEKWQGLLHAAAALYRQMGDTAGVARCLALRASPWQGSGPADPERARKMAGESVELARSQPDRCTLGFVLCLAGRLEGRRGDLDEAIRRVEESLAVFRELGQPSGVARSLHELGVWRRHTDTALARSLYEEAYALSRMMGDPVYASVNLNDLALLEGRGGDEAQRIARLEENVARCRDAGTRVNPHTACALARVLLRRAEADRAKALLEDVAQLEGWHPDQVAWACWSLSRLTRADGDLEAARRYEEKAQRLLVMARHTDEPERFHVLGGMGHAAREVGDYDQARALYGESLELRRKLDNRLSITQSLEDHGVLASMEGQHERAARLFGAAEAQAERPGQPVPVVMTEDFHRSVGLSKAALGAEAFAAAWAEGRAMSLERAVEYALCAETGD